MRPFYWSVRRELWENRSIYAAPIAVSAVVVLGFVIGAVAHPDRIPSLMSLPAARAPDGLSGPFGIAAAMGLVGAAVLVGAFYALESFQGERRDRSILFWKSLPVSDATTVLSKAVIPLLVLPVLTCLLIIATQFLMLVLGSAVVLMTGGEPRAVWTGFPFRLWPALLWFYVSLTLWHAPFYGWLLLVSAWARRAAFLWATLPLLAIGALERVAWNTSRVAAFLTHRWMGFFGEAFVIDGTAPPAPEHFPRMAPEKLLATPELWLGLAFTVLCLAAAARVRRDRDPA